MTMLSRETRENRPAGANKPPEGKYSTTAILYTNTNSDGATQFDDQVITSAQSGIFTLKADVMAKDTFTGEVIRLDGIRVKTESSVISKGFAPGQKFELSCVSYEAFRRGQIDQMELVSCPESPVIQNPAIPQPAVIKNSINSLADSKTAQCAAFNQKYNSLKRKLGLIHDRDDIVMYRLS